MRILYIDIDSQRPDHLGCYGYQRGTSPCIDEIARDGILFERVYTSDAHCPPSRTALYSGRFGIQTGAVGHRGTAADPKLHGPERGSGDFFRDQGLATQLQRLGYHTAMISPFGQRHAAWHIYAGFHEIHNTGRNGLESAEEVQPVVDEWLRRHLEEDNWYLHVNYWDPHTPYRVPADFGDPFAQEPLPEWLDDEELIKMHQALTGPRTALDFGGMYNDSEKPEYPRYPGKVTDLAAMRKVIDGYDTAVCYVDAHIGRIMEMLKGAGVYDETMVIISADHGENLGEMGIYGEHGTADEFTCHIPLIIRYPGGAMGARDSGFHYNVDLAPTIMELLGGVPQPLWDGESFAEAIRSGGRAKAREELILSQCSHVCQRAVRWDKWIYIRTQHDGFHLFPIEMLFDLDADPYERHDIAGQFPLVCQEGSWRLLRWHDAQMAKMAKNTGDVVDPLLTVMREGGPYHARLGYRKGSPGTAGFQKYLQRLELTGRAGGAAELRVRYSELLKEPPV